MVHVCMNNDIHVSKEQHMAQACMKLLFVYTHTVVACSWTA